MRTSIRLCFTALTAALLLSSAVATTSARNLSFSIQNWRVVWSELQFATNVITITCRVTLEGTFHNRTLIKSPRALIGYVTAAAVTRPCTGGEAWTANGRESHPRLGTLANTLPWHLTYEGFVGTLPNITEIHLLFRGVKFKIHSVFNTLGLYGDANDNITGRAVLGGGGIITTLEPISGRNALRLVDCLGGICPGSGALTNVRPGQVFNPARLRVTLI